MARNASRSPCPVSVPALMPAFAITTSGTPYWAMNCAAERASASASRTSRAKVEGGGRQEIGGAQVERVGGKRCLGEAGPAFVDQRGERVATSRDQAQRRALSG